MAMEAKKPYNLPFVSWRMRKTDDIIQSKSKALRMGKPMQ